MTNTVTTATGIPDVISQLCAFAVTNAGFAAETDAVVSGSRTMKRISKGGIYWHFVPYASGNGILCFMSYTLETTDAPGTTSTAQPYVSRMSAWSFSSSFPNLYLYTDDSSVVYMCVELTTGIFNHIGFGSITKTETFTGGEFITAGDCEATYLLSSVTYFYSVELSTNRPVYSGQYTNKSVGSGLSFLRISGTNSDYRDFAPLGTTLNSNRAGFSGVQGLNEEVLRDAPNEGTLRTPMLPMYVCVLDSVSSLYRLSGYLPNIRVIPNKYVDPAELLLTTWQCFPLTQKNATGLLCSPCDNYGLAYEKV